MCLGVLQRALEGRRSLARLLTETPEAPGRTPLPAPDPAALKAAGQPLLAAETLYVGAPGAQRPAVRGASFALHPGSAVGIAGPSASGKSTLARALTGVWPALSGIPDPREVALIGLVDVCDLLGDIFPERNIDRLRPRIEQLRKMDLIGRELAGAISDIEHNVKMALSGARS